MAASDHRSRAMVRDADQQAQMKQLGAAETVVADLEGDVSHAVEGCDAVVFVAGSGGGTGPDKTDAIDRDGAIGMVDAARKAGVKRFVMRSESAFDLACLIRETEPGLAAVTSRWTWLVISAYACRSGALQIRWGRLSCLRSRACRRIRIGTHALLIRINVQEGPEGPDWPSRLLRASCAEGDAAATGV